MKDAVNKHLPVHPGRRLAWRWVGLATANPYPLGVAEASDFGPGRLYARVWDDAADVGFWVQGRLEKRLYTLVRENTKDDEIVSWVFTDSKDPRRTITVFND